MTHQPAKPAYDITVVDETLEIHLHRDFDANGRDSNWVSVLGQRFPGPYSRVVLDLTQLGQRVNSSFFSGLYLLHQLYSAPDQPPVILRGGTHERIRQGLEILSLSQFFTIE